MTFDQTFEERKIMLKNDNAESSKILSFTGFNNYLLLIRLLIQ